MRVQRFTSRLIKAFSIQKMALSGICLPSEGEEPVIIKSLAASPDSIYGANDEGIYHLQSDTGTWVCLAFIFPSLLGLFVGTLDPIPSIEIVSSRKRAQLANIDDEFRPMELLETTKLSEAPSVDNPSAAHRWATYFTKRHEIKTRIADEHVDQQFRQVRLARELTQISPIVCFQYAMEGLANTGIVSYMDFLNRCAVIDKPLLTLSKRRIGTIQIVCISIL